MTQRPSPPRLTLKNHHLTTNTTVMVSTYSNRKLKIYKTIIPPPYPRQRYLYRTTIQKIQDNVLSTTHTLNPTYRTKYTPPHNQTKS